MATEPAELVGGLRARVVGETIVPGDSEYEQARCVYNGMHDRRPAAIVRPTDTADVAAAVSLARDSDLALAVRGGSHSVAGFGTCDGGVVVDLSAMRRVDVDAEARIARADGGCTWADFNNATHEFGLATTGGVLSTTGIAGLTLGGGFGYLSRPFGLACDNLVAAEVVTADGEVLRCNETENEMLFWALRGGGGNFGVVTSFEYRLHPAGEIVGGVIFFPLERDVLRGLHGSLAAAPEELGAVFGIAPAPPMPFVSEEWHGRPALGLIVCWTGPPDTAAEALRPLEESGPVVGRQVGPMPYPIINTLFDELLPPGLRQYWKASYAKGLPDAAVDVHVTHGAAVPTIESGIFFFPLDGAVRRPAQDETAFGHRDADYAVVVAGAWPNAADDEANIAWVRRYYDALAPYAEEGGYVNFAAEDDRDRVGANYGRNYDRLRDAKRRYDPDNVFRLNQNIAPA